MTEKIKYVLLRETDDGEDKIPLTIEFDYSPPHSGISEYRGGPLISPADEAEIDICTVTDDAGKEFKLTKEEEETVSDACWQDVTAAKYDREEAAAEDWFFYHD